MHKFGLDTFPCCLCCHNFGHGVQHTFGQNAKRLALQNYECYRCKNENDIKDHEEHKNFKVALMGVNIHAKTSPYASSALDTLLDNSNFGFCFHFLGILYLSKLT